MHGLQKPQGKYAAFILILSPQRSGSNHLSFLLHAQSGIFSFSERLNFGLVDYHDCIGNKQSDDMFSIKKFEDAKFLVWKNSPSTMETLSVNEGTGQVYKAKSLPGTNPLNVLGQMKSHNTRVVIHLRHPAMVFRSFRNMFIRTQEKEWDVTPIGITDLFVETFKHIDYWAKVKPLADPMITFHEDTIEDSSAAVRNILNFAGIGIDKVRSPVDYLKSHYEEKFWTVEGYGGYMPLKKKDPEHERLACREEVNSLLSATYSFTGVDLVRDIEQRVKLEINNISDATLSILDEFVDYYKTRETYR